MIFEVAFTLLVVLVLGSVIAVIVVAARDRTVPADPGMGTVRRLFVYALAALGLVAGANGVAWLLQAAVGALLGIPELTRDAAIALGVALTAVGVPAWLVFWGMAQRAVRAKPHEATFLLRQVYVYGFLAAATTTAAVAAIEALAAAMGVASRHPAAPMAVFVVWAAVWAFHARIERAQLPELAAGRILRLLQIYVVAVVALAALALATARALQLVLDAGYRTLVGQASVWSAGSPPPADEFRFAIAGAVVAGIVWWWYGHRSARPATDGWPRAAATYAFGIFPGAATVVVAASVLLHQALQVAFGTGSAVERFAVLPGVLAAFVVGGALLAFHDGRARAEAALDPAQARSGRRISDLLLATIGLAAVAVGLVQALSAVFAALAPDAAALHGDAWRDPTMLAITLLAVGGPLWAITWRGLQRRAAADLARERAATARRLYLTVAFGVAVAVALAAASAALYQIVVAILEGRGFAVLWDVRLSLGTALVLGAVGAYHGVVLRADQRALAAVVPPVAPRARPGVLVVARRGDEGVVRMLETRWGEGMTIWWREDGSASEAGALDVDALAARLEAVAAPRAIVWIGAGEATVVPVAEG